MRKILSTKINLKNYLINIYHNKMSTYYKSQLIRRNRYVKGKGIIDSLFSAVSSQAVKDVVTNVAKKQLTNVGNKLSEKAINTIIQPRKKKLSENSQRIIDKYTGGKYKTIEKGIIPIEEYVKTF